jgi:hypothetical protein
VGVQESGYDVSQYTSSDQAINNRGRALPEEWLAGDCRSGWSAGVRHLVLWVSFWKVGQYRCLCRKALQHWIHNQQVETNSGTCILTRVKARTTPWVLVHWHTVGQFGGDLICTDAPVRNAQTNTCFSPISPDRLPRVRNGIVGSDVVTNGRLRSDREKCCCWLGC